MRPMIWFLVIMVILVSLACEKKLLSIPPAPPDANSYDASVCTEACMKLAQCNIDAGFRPGCTNNCIRDQAQGNARMLAPECIVGALTCSEVKACK